MKPTPNLTTLAKTAAPKRRLASASSALRVGTLLTLTLLSGCVKKSDYEALKQKAGSTEAALQQEIQEQADKLTSLTGALKAAEAQTAERQEAIAALEAQLDEAEKTHAELLKDRTNLAASVQEMKAALASLQAQRRLSEARVAEYRKLLGRFKQLIDAGKLRVKIVDGRMVVELPSDILFASGSIEISTAGKEAIAETAQILTDMGNRKFQVEGHTDDQPINTSRFPNNWALAAGRAIAVLEVMVEAGMPRQNLSATSYADVVPAASNKQKAGRAKNRRMEIAMVPDFSVLPGFEELQKLSRP